MCLEMIAGKINYPGPRMADLFESVIFVIYPAITSLIYLHKWIIGSLE
jgi:hypothetical protein